MLRAEFPVHKNRTLKTFSLIDIYSPVDAMQQRDIDLIGLAKTLPKVKVVVTVDSIVSMVK